MRQIEKYLGDLEDPEDDFRDLEDACLAGSCDWLTDRGEFQEWLTGLPGASAKIFWVHAKPGAGKSVLSGHIVSSLSKLNYDCSYYFFRHAVEARSLASSCLLSLLWQTALRNGFARERLLDMARNEDRFDRENAKNIWRKVIEPILISPGFRQVQYWVIDALDECSEISTMFTVLAKLTPTVPLKIFITSRRTDEITRGFNNLSKIPAIDPLLATEVQVQDTWDSIALYLEANKHMLHIHTEVQGQSILDKILQKSQGSFLWVRLVMDELSTVWTLDQVEQVLNEVPQEMDLLYMRILGHLGSRPPRDVKITRAIINWTLYAIRPMTVDELQAALQLDIGTTVQNPHEGIPALCSQLVNVDTNGRVLMIHLTARTFLQEQDSHTFLATNPASEHELIARICLNQLVSDELEPPKGKPSFGKPKKRADKQTSPFTAYAAFNFAEHISLTKSHDTSIIMLLYRLLGKNIFTWIEMMSASNSLPSLLGASDVLRSYTRRESEYSQSLGEQIRFIDTWATDLRRLAMKFGNNLVEHPSSIHWYIPPFCPKSSAISRVFGKHAGHLEVLNSDDNWDEKIACIDFAGQSARAVACGKRYFAVAFGSTVILCHAITCQRLGNLGHGSHIWQLGFDQTDEILVVAGEEDLAVWDLESHEQTCHFEVRGRILTFAIHKARNELVAALKNGTIVRWNITDNTVISITDNTIISKIILERNFQDRIYSPVSYTIATLSPDTGILAAAERLTKVFEITDAEDGQLMESFYDEDTGSPRSLRPGLYGPVSCLVFNRDRSVPLLAVGYMSEILRVFNYDDLSLSETTLPRVPVFLHCSTNGHILVVGYHANDVELYNFKTLRLLPNSFTTKGWSPEQRDSATSLAFNSDNTRFFQIFKNQCNIWEVELPSLDSTQDGVSKTAKGSDEDGNEVFRLGERITAMTTCTSGDYCFVGMLNGAVWQYGTTDGKPQRLLHRHNHESRTTDDKLQRLLNRHNHESSITHMVWGGKTQILATGDASGKFVVCQVDTDTVTTLLTGELPSVPRQLLLNPQNDLFLASTHQKTIIWDLTARAQVFSTENNPWPWLDPSRFNNPANPLEYINLGKGMAEIFDWKAPREESPRCEIPIVFEKSPSFYSWRLVASIFGGSSIAVEAIDLAFSSRAILLFDISPLAVRHGTLKPSHAFQTVCVEAYRIIGTFRQRFVFLDKQLCVCSLERLSREIGDSEPKTQLGLRRVKHFFIPVDWHVRDDDFVTNKMAVVGNGDVMFVRETDVRIVRRGLSVEWDERVVWDDTPDVVEDLGAT